MASASVLECIKNELERVYEIHVPLAIHDFLTTDRDTANALADGDSFTADEFLFVSQDDSGAYMTLFIDGTIIEHLDEDNPLTDLHDGNLASFCVALEGVSHFIYLAWRASFDRPVTQLELEMQAEVDKFVASRRLMERQSAGSHSPGLGERLFDQVSYRSDLDASERERYEAANSYAGRYCRRLDARWHSPGDAVTRDLRRFYRLNQRQKIRHIAQVN